MLQSNSMTTKTWTNTAAGILLEILYNDNDIEETEIGTCYTIRRWNILVENLHGAGFLDDNGTHVFVMRGDNRYDLSLKVYEKKNAS